MSAPFEDETTETVRRYKVRYCPHGKVRAGASYEVGNIEEEQQALAGVNIGEFANEQKYSYRDQSEAPTFEECEECREAIPWKDAVAVWNEELEDEEEIEESIVYGGIAWPPDEELTPKQIVEKAIDLVYGDRNKDYGHPADDYGRTAALWSAFLGHEITPFQAAICMVLVKISREAHKHKPDNLVDSHGYLLVAARILAREAGKE